jgi:hypothetical protein
MPTCVVKFAVRVAITKQRNWERAGGRKQEPEAAVSFSDAHIQRGALLLGPQASRLPGYQNGRWETRDYQKVRVRCLGQAGRLLSQ